MAFVTVWFMTCAVVMARSDCDLVLLWCCKWGKKPEKVLCDKIIWITGASSGIGEHLCYALAKCGSILVLSARREEELKRVFQCCKGKLLEFVQTPYHIFLSLPQKKMHPKQLEGPSCLPTKDSLQAPKH